MIGDPFSAIADIIVGWHRTGIVVKYFKLIFGILFSFWITFNTVAGGCLVAHLGWPVSIGYGMAAGAAMALTSYIRSDTKLTSGITVAVPTKTEEDASVTPIEVITKSGKL